MKLPTGKWAIVGLAAGSLLLGYGAGSAGEATTTESASAPVPTIELPADDACRRLEGFATQVITGRVDASIGGREGDRLHHEYMRSGSPFTHREHDLVLQAYLQVCKGVEDPWFWRYGPTERR